MLTEQQRLIIADMVNNEILRFENGIKDETYPPNTLSKSIKNESVFDAGSADDEKQTPASQSAISLANDKPNQ